MAYKVVFGKLVKMDSQWTAYSPNPTPEPEPLPAGADVSCDPVPYIPVHVDDWLDEPAKDAAEAMAKEWLEHFRRPAIDKNYGWLAANALFCTYRNVRYRCIGCSRLGDVWLTGDFTKVNGYDLRIDVAECSDWSKAP